MPKSAIKCVIVGDGAVGKTSLLMSYTSNKFPKDYVPTIAENCSVTVRINGNPFTLNIFDTAGQEDYAHIRPLAYPGTDVFLVCFDVTSTNSFENIESIWIPEITHYKKDAPFLLVGTKIDIRTNSKITAGKRVIKFEEGKMLAKKLGAIKYVECSGYTQVGLKNVFEQAIIAGLIKPKIKKRLCSVM